MKARWVQFARKVDSLTLRERVLGFCAAVALVVYGIFALAIEPAQQQQLALQLKLQQQREQIVLLQKQQALPDSSGERAEAARARHEALARRIAEADEALQLMHKAMVPAHRMNLLLQEMLQRDAKLELVSLRTIPAAPLLDSAKPSASPAAPAPSAPRRELVQSNVYKHGVEITIRGEYGDLYEYLVRLERSPSSMYWTRARLAAAEHPRLTITLTIYTLSADKAWLQV